MSHIRCSKCDRETHLECAHANRGFSGGFVCRECYHSQVVVAVIVAAVIGGLAVLFLANLPRNDMSGETASTYLPLPKSAVSYTRNGVTTDIEEIVGFPLQPVTARFESTWRDHLLAPITLDDLAAANFGYSDNLFRWNCTGSVTERNSKEVTVVVKCADTYRFLVKQTRMEPDPSH